MFGGFKSRRPWAAAIVSFFIAPFIGMLFLNRGRLALIYLGAFIGIVVFALVVMLPTTSSVSTTTLNVQIIGLLISLIGAIHAFFLARHWDFGQPLKWYSRYWCWIAGGYLGFFAIYFGVRTFLYQPFNVPSAAMIPTVNVGDFFFASKFAYNSKDPNRGDVVVFHVTKFGTVTFFKRIVGNPGDQIQMKSGVLFINGAPVSRKRVSDFHMHCPSGDCAVEQYEETLPEGRSYRVIDLDPQGPSNNTEVFTVPAGTYFVLGDNRDNSADSRNSFGYIPRENIFGQVAYKYISNGHWTWQLVN